MLFGRVISVGIGYLCGMFLSGFLYGKKENVDLRKVGQWKCRNYQHHA